MESNLLAIMFPVKKILKKISIVDLLNLAFLSLLITLFIFSFSKTPYRFELALSDILLLGFYLFSIWARNRNIYGQWQKLISFIALFVFFFALFETFFMILPYFNTARFDALLNRIDLSILGVSPTLWMEQWAHPLFTEILYISYFLYFPLPLIILGWMFYKKLFISVEKYFFIFLLTYYGAYLSYFIFPAAGPRFFLQDQYTIQLTGYFFTDFIRAVIDTLEPNKLDAFPSLHTAILLTTMIVSFKFNRKMFYIFLPLAVLILVSLTYCRYHYFIDIAVGAAWSVFAYLAGSWIFKKFHPHFKMHLGNDLP